MSKNVMMAPAPCGPPADGGKKEFSLTKQNDNSVDREVASLYIKTAGVLGPLQRKKVAEWLRKQARAYEVEGPTYTEHTFNATLTFRSGRK